MLEIFPTYKLFSYHMRFLLHQVDLPTTQKHSCTKWLSVNVWFSIAIILDIVIIFISFYFCLKKQKRLVTSNFYNCTILFDVEDPIMCCRWCGAKMLLDERVEWSGSEGNVEFSLCCMKGKVHLPHLQKPLKLLFNLLRGDHPKSKHYLDNIRAYNNMFSFT